MKRKSVIIFVLLASCKILYSQVPDTLKFVLLKPHEFQQAYINDEKALLIDVREFFEYRKSRLKDAVNIPSSGKLEPAADTLSKESPLFLYCTSGFRSRRVAVFFHDRGFLKAYSLDGGIVAWRKEKMPVDKKRLKRHGLRHKESR